MAEATSRRHVVALMAAPLVLALLRPAAEGDPATARSSKIKLSCNLYSFNEPLRSGAMTLEQGSTPAPSWERK